jgi:hypothetical protein
MKHRKDSLIIEIAGGLGNQLFMFYAGLFFKEKLRKEIIFDISDLKRIAKLHPGENIQTLGLLDEFATTTRPIKQLKILSRAFSRLEGISVRLPIKSTFVPQEIGFVNSDLVPSNVVRIRGYFQSWRYFDSLNEKPILSISNLQNPSDWLIKNLAISKNERILSFHVRRGDYALPSNRMNGILSEKYYENVLSQVKDYDRLWVFTDAPKELEFELSNRGFPFEIVSPPAYSAQVESLLLMSSSKHIAISNSTFSWWSAKLAGADTSIFAPSKWYELRDDPIDLIPDSWNRATSDWMEQ